MKIHPRRDIRSLLAMSAVLAMPFVVTTSAEASIIQPGGSCSSGSYTETTDGTDTIGTFRSPAQLTSSTGCTWTVPSGVNNVRVLVVAGGGGGGGYLTSGGGGGGGVIHEVGYDVTSGSSISVTVGRGGATGSNNWNLPNNYNNGANGDDSVFGSLTAIGGGGGGGGGTNSQLGNPGSSGGSGGGGGRCWVHCNTSLSASNGNKRVGGAATTDQGNRGGDAPFINGAGGGGAGAAGAPSTGGASGNGGDGISVDISGVANYFGGGGGGGSETTAVRASGGLGGGGQGAANGNADGEAGTDGTGGGGGGARDGVGAAGGSGIVIVRWGSAPSTPAFTINQTSEWVEVNTTSSSMYSIVSTGASITRFAVSPNLPTGMSLNTSTGVVSGTPSTVQSETTYTLTGYRVSSTNGATSQLSRTFSIGVYSGSIPTTTTTTTTTTTVPTTTTVAPNNTVAPPTEDNSSITSGGSSVAQSRSTVTTVAATLPVVTTTTIPPTTTTTTTIPVPDAPEVSSGEGGLTVDGEEVETTLTRSNNALVVSGGGIEASVYGVSEDGTRIDLDEDGLLRFSDIDRIVVEASGFSEGDGVDVWMYSTPTRLGVLKVNASGAIKGEFVLPVSLDKGDHRIVLEGANNRGENIVLSVGVSVGEVNETSLAARLLIVVPVSMAILAALIIPTTVRRRREETIA